MSERPKVIAPMMAPRNVSPRERMIRLRLMLVGLSLCLWAVVVLVRLLHLQVLERVYFQHQAARQSERTLVLDPRRGPILDRQGRSLAVSVDAESIYAVPNDISDPETTTAVLAKALGLDAGGRKDLLGQLRRNRAFYWVKRKADPAVVRAVREAQLEGIGFMTENRRFYPKRELASQVMGYVGLDNAGMSGVEYAFDDMIKGRGAKVVVRTDARRRPMGETERPSTEGAAVTLTIDEVIQHLAETELERSIEETQSIAGVVVVMDPRTGEILALANRPTFNPNRYGAYQSGSWRNRAVADAYEPGSIFKVFTAAAGLQEKVVEPDEVLDCGGGSVDVAGVHINDHAVFFKLSFRDVIAKSSDVGVVRVAQRVGRESFSRYLRDFGFGAPTGVDLPGESSGLLRPTSRWSAISLASLSFGQEVGVTALQIATAAAAVANGGHLMKPLIVREVEDGSGRVLKSYRPTEVRRVLEPHTVEVLTELLRGVVTGGTGRKAAIPGYAVAGKTGTAQKIDATGRYSMIDHVASFVGFVPASRPALLVLVSLDTPRGLRNQGGDVAAPLFARIAEPTLRYLAIPPDDTDRVLRLHAPAPESVLLAAYEPPRAGPTVTPTSSGEMPDLRGQSAREAAVGAARRGLMVQMSGSGRVVAQSPEPGAPLEPGALCQLTLAAANP